jgi:hypothetical protein
MSELHWTGAAVLLALAVLGNGGTRPRRARILSGTDFAREHDLDAEPQQGSDAPPCLAAARVRSGRPRSAQTRRAS